jgi:L-lysine exporter family protein LysE/ArgO
MVRFGGAAFLLAYAALALRRAITPGAVDLVPGQRSGRAGVLMTCAALTWLNPHVFLDTVLLPGPIAATRQDGRWWFAVGAIAGSAVWFSTLGYGARFLQPVFARPSAWRVLDALIATTMTMIAISLLR